LRLPKSQSQLQWSHLHFIHMSAVHIIFIYLFLVQINNYTASQNDFNLVLKCNNNIVNMGEKMRIQSTVSY